MTSYLTDDEIEALQTSGLPTDTPYVIRSVSYTQFSIARFYGGITWNGYEYRYIDETDEAIRQDVDQWITKRRKAAKRAAIEADEVKQRQLFGEAE